MLRLCLGLRNSFNYSIILFRFEINASTNYADDFVKFGQTVWRKLNYDNIKKIGSDITVKQAKQMVL